MNRRLFEIEIFCNIIKVFNATFYIINVSLGNNFFKKKKKSYFWSGMLFWQNHRNMHGQVIMNWTQVHLFTLLAINFRIRIVHKTKSLLIPGLILSFAVLEKLSQSQLSRYSRAFSVCSALSPLLATQAPENIIIKICYSFSN